MNGDVIKSFLVSLGFGVDDASLKRFNQAIASATLKVTALYASTRIAAAGIGLGISKISSDFEQMGYEYRIIAPAINKALALRRELLKAYSAAGINITKVIQDSVKLNFSLAKTRFAFEAIYKSVASRFFALLTKQSDAFRKKIYENMPKIQAALERFVNFVFKAFEALTALGDRVWSILSRVYDFFVALDKATNGWSTIILGAAAAWKILNLGFLATPLGMLFTLATTLLTLYDDFKTFQEGGESLINWGSETTKLMVGLAGVIGAVGVAIAGVVLAMKAWAVIQAVVDGLLIFGLGPLGLFLAAITAIGAAIGYLLFKMGIFKDLAGTLSGFGGKILSFVGGANVAQNLQNGGVPQVSPVGAGVQNSQTNQNVQQQTAINVIGSADAGAVGKAVASEQGKVNFDMARNMKGATR